LGNYFQAELFTGLKPASPVVQPTASKHWRNNTVVFETTHNYDKDNFPKLHRKYN